MFFDLGETYSVIIEQYIGNALVSCQQTAAPKEFLMMQFMGLCEEAYRQPQPIKLYGYCPNCGAKMDGGAVDGWIH